jgi:tetratricopeptide (TPR) repeat protein
MRLAIGTWIVIGSALLAGSAWADEVLLADGNTLEGKVLEVREDAVKVTFSPEGGGTITMDYPAARLDPHYFYGLRDQAAGQDAKARLRLALWAVEQGMFSRAKSQVKKAAAIDPQLVKDIEEGKLPEIREGIADRILASAESDIQAGRLDRADEKLQLLLARLPDTEAGNKARDLLRSVEAKQDEEEAKQEAKKAAEDDAKLKEDEKKAAAERKKLLDGVWRGLKQGKKWMNEGLVEESDSKALEILAKALGRGREGIKELDEIVKTRAADATLVSEAETWRAKVVAAMVRVHLHRSDIYVWRGSLKQARDEVKEAMALDTNNLDAISALQRISDAQSDDTWGIRWRRGAAAPGSRFAGGRGGGGRRR